MPVNYKYASYLLLTLLILVFACSKDDSTPEKTPPEVQNDVTPPTVSFSIAGGSQQDQTGTEEETDTTGTVVAQRITIDIAAEDAVGISKVEAFVDDALAGEDHQAPFQIELDFSDYAAKGLKLNKTQTQHTLKVSATDLAGNVASTQQQVVVDSEMPVISEVSMTNDTLLTGEENLVSFKATDNEALAMVKAFIDDTPLEVAADSLQYSFNINTSILTDGTHTLLIAATDQVELRAEYTLNFSSDNTAPVMELKKLSSGSSADSLTVVTLPEEESEIPVVARYAQLDIQAEDTGGIREVTAYIDNKLTARDSISPYTLLLDLTEIQAKSSTQYKSDTLYTLKVITANMVGLKDSIIQQVYLDNIKPVISDLNLKNKQGVTGADHPVQFKVTDNHILENVQVQIDNTTRETTRDSMSYTLNLDTFQLNEGWHTLTISAEDAAHNLQTQTVEFFTDNTPPQISVSGISNGQTIDSILPVDIRAIDQTSETDSIVVSFNGIPLYRSGEETLAMDFDPDLVDAGSMEMIVQATDTLGNSSSTSFTGTIVRRLFAFKVPDRYLNGGADGEVFLSRTDGSLIVSQPMTDGQTTTIYAPGDFPPDEPFMVTFFIHIPTGTPNSYLYTINGIKRSDYDFMAINKNPVMLPKENQQYTMDGFDTNDRLYTKATDNNGVIPTNTSYFDLTTFRFYNPYMQNESDFAFVYYYNSTTSDYGYTFQPKPLDPGVTQLVKSDFSTDGLDTFPTSISGAPNNWNYVGGKEPVSIRLDGFYTLTDFENNHYHTLYKEAVRNGQVPVMNGFQKYRTHAYISNYKFVHEGKPKPQYDYPSWSVDYQISGKTITPMLSGANHEVGKIFLNKQFNEPVHYEWKVRFDSQNTTSLQLPELPEHLSGIDFYNYYNSNQLSIYQMEIIDYSDFDDYRQFLKGMILNHKDEHYHISNSAESMFKVYNNNRAYLDLGDKLWRG